MTYSDKLKDPRWIEKRDRVLARDNHRCQICRIGCKTESLHVHHRWYYPGKEPWEYNMRSLITVDLSRAGQSSQPQQAH
jgi:5-methylcytosine-specific restriction endonuclease McrA